MTDEQRQSPVDLAAMQARQPDDTDNPEGAQERMSLLLTSLKALADLSRLRIVGALATQERTVEELADLLDLKAPTVSHHLARLRTLGLVETRAEGVTRWNRLDVAGLERLAKLLTAPQMVATLTADAEDVTWERKTLRNFFDGERLREIPARRKQRQVILRWLVEQFAWEREYSESEVNAVLKRHHPDVAYLRRDLIGERLMARDHGRYWRTEPLTEETLRQMERRLEWGRIYSDIELLEAIREQTRDPAAARLALLERGTLASERNRYWLARPPEDRLS